MKITLLILSILIFKSCGDSSEESYNRGQSEGSIAGYNYLCGGGETYISANWDDKHYSEGYAEGFAIGVADCFYEKSEDTQEQIYEMEEEIEILKQTVIELQN